MVNGCVTRSIDFLTQMQRPVCAAVVTWTNCAVWQNILILCEVLHMNCFPWYKSLYLNAQTQTFLAPWDECHKNLNAQEGCSSELDLEWQKEAKLAPDEALVCLSSVFNRLKVLLLFVSPPLRGTTCVPGKLTGRPITQSYSKHGLRCTVQPQAVGIPVAQGHRQRAVHRLCPG